jgi:phosphoribosylformimino-5-aminoimidazole carboxamide ribonucleotide (ProFAR) isomerase
MTLLSDMTVLNHSHINRWQKFSDLRLSEATLDSLASSCDEFLVHGVDVEGMQLGIDEELVDLLGRWSPIPVTYAGGARTLVSMRVNMTYTAQIYPIYLIGRLKC